MAIQMRRGDGSKFMPSKMLPGEWAVVLSGDREAGDGKAVYACFGAGDVKRMATVEDMSEQLLDVNDELIAELTAETKAATASANKAASSAASAATTASKGAETANASAKKADAATSSANSAAKSANAAAQTASSAASAANANANAASTQAAAAKSAAQQAQAAARLAKPYHIQDAEPPRSERVQGAMWVQTEGSKVKSINKWDSSLPGQGLYPGADTYPGPESCPGQPGDWHRYTV